MIPFTTRYAKAKAMLELIRLQNAPVGPEEAADKLLIEIKAEVANLSLPESDALWFYRKMQRDGWRFGGVPVTDWRWTISNFADHSFFPSQRRCCRRSTRH